MYNMENRLLKFEDILQGLLNEVHNLQAVATHARDVKYLYDILEQVRLLNNTGNFDESITGKKLKLDLQRSLLSIESHFSRNLKDFGANLLNLTTFSNQKNIFASISYEVNQITDSLKQYNDISNATISQAGISEMTNINVFFDEFSEKLGNVREIIKLSVRALAILEVRLDQGNQVKRNSILQDFMMDKFATFSSLDEISPNTDGPHL